MIIFEFIVILLAALGLINIIIYSPIMEWYRDLVITVFSKLGKEKMGKYLVSCPTCTGFWVGVVLTPIFLLGLTLYTLPFVISFIAYLAQLYWFPED